MYRGQARPALLRDHQVPNKNKELFSCIKKVTFRPQTTKKTNQKLDIVIPQHLARRTSGWQRAAILILSPNSRGGGCAGARGAK